MKDKDEKRALVRFDLTIGGCTSIGGRENNEDAFGSFGIHSADRALAVLFVADGLGGEAHGERGSAAVASALPGLILAHSRPPKARQLIDFPKLFAGLDAAVEASGGQTTATLVVLDRCTGRYALAWCGDSPGLVLRRNKEQGTRNQEQGAPDAFSILGQVEPHGFGSLLVRGLGFGPDRDADRDQEPTWTPEVVVGDGQIGDVFLLASDGLDPLLESNPRAISPPPLGHTLRRLAHNDLLGTDEPGLDRLTERLVSASLDRWRAMRAEADNQTIVLGVVQRGIGKVVREMNP